MNAHAGADVGAGVASGLVHTVAITAVNMADITETAALLHGRARTVFADAGYTGADKRPELQGLAVDWQTAAPRSTIKKIDPKRPLRAVLKALRHAKASILAKVEHSFHVVKNLFRHRKARYKGLAKKYGTGGHVLSNGKSGACKKNC